MVTTGSQISKTWEGYLWSVHQCGPCRVPRVLLLHLWWAQIELPSSLLGILVARAQGIRFPVTKDSLTLDPQMKEPSSWTLTSSPKGTHWCPKKWLGFILRYMTPSEGPFLQLRTTFTRSPLAPMCSAGSEPQLPYPRSSPPGHDAGSIIFAPCLWHYW